MTYQPKYTPEELDLTNPEQREALAHIIHQAGLTHLKTTTGKVWKITGTINTKTIPIDEEAPNAPKRVAFNKIETFGVIEETPTATASNGEPPATAPIHHADRAHALLAASSANRWLHCTPSPQLETHYPDTTTDAAQEGTTAHELAEHKLHTLLNTTPPPTPPEHTEWVTEEMQAHTDDYAHYVMAEYEAAKQKSPAAFLTLEHRVNFSHIVPDGFGTADALIIADNTLTIIDLKYGKGVEVSATGNPQLRLYALGALHQFGMIYTIKQVKMVIFQPRLGNTSIDEISVEELNRWAKEVVKPAARLAQAGQGELKAGAWCQFCRHAPKCPELARTYFKTLPTQPDKETHPVLPEPNTLTDEQVARIVENADELKKWLNHVKTFALNEILAGKNYPGVKVVEGRSTRRYTDENQVAHIVEALGINPWEKKLLGITDMTKALGGAKKFNTVLGDLVVKPAGKPVIVPETDKRPALQVATPETVFTPINN